MKQFQREEVCVHQSGHTAAAKRKADDDGAAALMPEMGRERGAAALKKALKQPLGGGSGQIAC